MKYYCFKTFTTSYFFPEPIKEYSYMYGLYSAFGGVLSKGYWWLFRHCPIVRWANSIDEYDLSFPYSRIKQLDGSNSLMAFNMGTPSIEQKISILGYDFQSSSPFFAKYSEKQAARELTKNEINVYNLLQGSKLTPRLISYTVNDDAVYMKVEYVKGSRPRDIALTEDIVQLALSLTNYHLSGVCENDKGLKMTLSHGDFCPWNILVDDTHLRLIDWELAKDRTLGFDLFTFICHVSALLGDYEPMIQAIKKYERLIRKYFSNFDIIDYTPYLMAFLDEKIRYESSKEGSPLIEKYKGLMAAIMANPIR